MESEKIDGLERRIHVQENLYRVLLDLLISKKGIFTTAELSQVAKAHSDTIMAKHRPEDQETLNDVTARIEGIKEVLEANKPNE